MYFLRWIAYFTLYFFILTCSCQRIDDKLKKEIFFWSSNNPYEIEFAKAIVNEWTTLNPQIRIKYQPVPEGRSSEEIILAAVVGKTTPDIYSNMWQGDVEFYAQSGVLVPLDTLPGFLDFIYDRCDSATVSEVISSDGHIYQIPWKINPIMMVYNKSLLREVGYTNPPSTYSAYLDAGQKFQRDADGDGYVDRWIGYSEVLNIWYQRFFDFYPLYLAASGGASLVEGNEITFDNEYAIQAFQFLKISYENNYLPKERLGARSDAFLASVIATRFTGPWTIRQYEKFKPEGFEYAFHHMPVPDDFVGNIYTYADPKNIVIFNTCKDPILAWKFLKFMLRKEGDLHFLKRTHQLPRRQNLFKDEYFAEYFRENPRMIPFAKQAPYVRGTDSCPVLKEIFDVLSQEYEACVIYGVKTPEEAVKNAAQAAQLLLK